MSAQIKTPPVKPITPPPPSVPFIDLAAQQRRLQPGVSQAIERVLAHGQYVMGPEIRQLESDLAAYAGVRHCLTCGSGTDALVMSMMAAGIGPGDAVLCPAFTFAATAESIVLAGGSPVFVDVRADDYNIDPDKIEGALDAARAAGLTPRGIMPVDLFGQPARYPEIEAIAHARGLWVLADSAQSFGGSLDNRRVGAIGMFSATSFFPAKPLGCYGDGGAIFFDDTAWLEPLVSIRVHGQGTDKYDNVRIGLNGRMDTIQAAVLLEKLKVFEDEIEARMRIAQRYTDLLGDRVHTPRLAPGVVSVWAQYTIEVEERDGVVARLKAAGVPTGIYYPKPLHTQKPYAGFPTQPGGLPVTDRLAGRVLSLPMHAYLDTDVQDYVATQVLAALA